jgi:hypothetical protein
MNQKRIRSGSLLNYFKVGPYITLNIELPESITQKPPIGAESLSTIINTSTTPSSEPNIQLNVGDNVIPKYAISLYVNKKISDYEKTNIIQNIWVSYSNYINILIIVIFLP